jgi:hypothetical protein
LAALEIATGEVVAHVRDRRTSVDFLNFMDDVVKSYPVKELHVVLAQQCPVENCFASRFLTMELLEGETLSAKLRREGPQTERRTR